MTSGVVLTSPHLCLIAQRVQPLAQAQAEVTAVGGRKRTSGIVGSKAQKEARKPRSSSEATPHPDPVQKPPLTLLFCPHPVREVARKEEGKVSFFRVIFFFSYFTDLNQKHYNPWVGSTAQCLGRQMAQRVPQQ